MSYKVIPANLLNEFTLSGEIPVIYEYSDDSRCYPIHWPINAINSYLERARAKEIISYKDLIYLYPGFDKYRSHIENKDVVVIGSEHPQYECVLLSYRAHPFTIEYNQIACSDPRIKIFTVKEFEMNPRTFDAILSVSSLEHDGLGRYGDPLNPNGDLLFMEKAKTMIPKGGLFFLQVPVAQDCLVFNLHRVYGKIRLPKLLKGWRVIETFGFSEEILEKPYLKDEMIQPLFVLTPE